MRAWAKTYPDYWRRYRADHPTYARRDNERRRRSRQAVRRAAKPNTIREIAVEKLRDIRSIPLENAAKPNAIVRRVEGLLDFLLWKESAAKANAIAIVVPAGIG
jgi:hypothetical protein